jgi:large subunit ribosomal protein L9
VLLSETRKEWNFKMKVILKQDIKGVGKKDQIINAADGYARNFLFPKDLAVPADTGNMNSLQAKKDSNAFRKGEELKEAKEVAEKLKKITVKMKIKAGENGKLFGGVTAKEIAEALKKDYNIEVDKKKVMLKDTIKVAGVTKVDIKLYEGVVATVNVMIIPA